MAQKQHNSITTTQYGTDSQTGENYDPDCDPKEDEKFKLIEDIKSIVCQKSVKKEPLNIVVLGCPGSGKSAFLNTVFTSLRTDWWTERARVGCFGSSGQQVTKHVISFTSELDYYQEEPEVLFPTFIDVQGLENKDKGFNTEFLQALLNGKIRNNQSMNELHSIFDNNDPGRLNALLNRQKDNLKIDRIIVVASADPTEILPKQFLQCIHDSMECKRDIPLFGVLTRADKFEKNDERISAFMNALGIREDKFLLMTNYCPDIDKHMRYHNKVFPYIDVPVLRFLKQVVNPHLRVITPNTKLLGTDWMELLKSSIACPGPCVILQTFLIMFFLYWISFPSLHPDKFNIMCADYDAYASKHHFEIPDLAKLCFDKKKIITFPVAKVSVFLVFIVFALPLLERHKQLILEKVPLSSKDRRRLLGGELDMYIYAAVFLITALALTIC